MKGFLKIFVAVFLLSLVDTTLCQSAADSRNCLSSENISSENQILASAESRSAKEFSFDGKHCLTPPHNNSVASSRNCHNSLQSRIRLAKRQLRLNLRNVFVSDGKCMPVSSLISTRRNSLMESSGFYRNNFILAVFGVFII